jgi:hypothetical protein
LLEVGDERRGIPLARGAACLGIGAVDAALQVEDRVDAPHRLECDGRDRRRVLSSARARGDVGEFENLRLAYPQHSASVTGAGFRSAAWSARKPA